MGTRSLTVFKDKNDKEICVMYKQWDGYPTYNGYGRDLAKFLSRFTIINGFGDKLPKMANGMGCLAAQVIKHFKKGIGDVYLEPPGTRNIWEEYIYEVSVKGDRPWIEVFEVSPGMSEGVSPFYGLIMEGYPEAILEQIKDMEIKDMEMKNE